MRPWDLEVWAHRKSEGLDQVRLNGKRTLNFFLSFFLLPLQTTDPKCPSSLVPLGLCLFCEFRVGPGAEGRVAHGSDHGPITLYWTTPCSVMLLRGLGSAGGQAVGRGLRGVKEEESERDGKGGRRWLRDSEPVPRREVGDAGEV